MDDERRLLRYLADRVEVTEVLLRFARAMVHGAPRRTPRGGGQADG
jgi:hypothetical protein